MNRPPVSRRPRQIPMPQTGIDPINDIIKRLEDRWRLGITIRDGTWSPSRQPRTDPGKPIFELIKFLYWQDRDLLHNRLTEFEDNAHHKNSREQLTYLQQLLTSAKSTVAGACPKPARITPKQNRLDPVSPRYDIRSANSYPGSGPHFHGFGEGGEVRRTTVRNPLGQICPSMPSAEASERRTEQARLPRQPKKVVQRVWGSQRSQEDSRVDSVFAFPQYREPRSANTSFTTEATVSQSGHHFDSSGADSWDEKFQEDAIHRVRESEKRANQSQATTRIEHREIEIPRQSQIDISPGKSGEQHQVRNLPREEDLFAPDVRAWSQKLPFKYRWEYLRAAQATDSNPEEFVQSKSEDYEAFWSSLMQHEVFRSRSATFPRSDMEAWTAPNFENVKLKASLAFNASNAGPLFKLHMQPLRMETSCRFQRAFGGDRLLYIEVPSFDIMPSHLSNQDRYLPERFVEWLARPKEFLGRTWMAFFVDPLPPKKRKNETTEMRGYQVVLFALEGCGLDRKTEKVSSRAPRQEMDMYDLVNWFMPLEEPNSSQAFPKAFARIALGLTTTYPGLSFKPSQVRYVDDIIADNSPEDDEFNDPALAWPPDPTTRRRVMNDGCARISVGAAQELWKKVGRGAPLPSTFQGRIGGAKGMWMLSASQDTRDPEHRDKWIEINDSQLKFRPHKDDKDDAKYDPQRLTFDLHSITGQASSSKIFRSFFPILQDRGVAEKSLLNLFDQYLEAERFKLFDAMEDPVRLRKWVNEQNCVREKKRREDGIAYQGAMPKSHKEKLVSLLESGFDPSSKYVADVAETCVSASLQELRTNIRIPLPRCTYIKGVADPLGILQPGECHIFLSPSLTDEVSGESTTFLDNRPVLVARNPALRRSDIQKVKARFRPELAHLCNVVVFPSVGKYPLAGKLQGGDYDGDTFWICWEPDLVDPFKNAPAPYQDPDPEDYGIKVDKRRLNELLKVKESSSSKRLSIQNFLRASFEYRCKSNLLGQATKLHERISYAENCIDSPNINALAGLHDLLVDSAKNGYSFDQSVFDDFKKNRLGLSRPVEEPAYERARKVDKLEKGTVAHSKELSKIRSMKKNNITDNMYFEAMEPHTRETFESVSKHFEMMRVEVDEDLLAPYKKAQAEEDPVIAEELKRLKKEIDTVKYRWNDIFRGGKDREDLMISDKINDWFQEFESIAPDNKTHSAIKYGTGSLVGTTPRELIKASALYHHYHKKSLVFVFCMAGKLLCEIKASQTRNPRLVVWSMYANMKPRRIKRVIREEKQQRSNGDGDEGVLTEPDENGTTE